MSRYGSIESSRVPKTLVDPALRLNNDTVRTRFTFAKRDSSLEIIEFQHKLSTLEKRETYLKEITLS